jgi:2'-5' RNA ligase
MPGGRARRKFGPSQKDRIFFACVPDDETAGRIHALGLCLKQDWGLEANLILPEHLHVTLFHLGDWAILPEEIVHLASGAASQVNVPAFEARFERVESFRNSTGIYPLVLTGEEAQWRGLHDALASALKDAGLGAATRGEFKPHITLAYDRQRLKPAAVEPIPWTVCRFVLIHSKLGKTTHIHLGQWPLQAA